MRTLQGYGGDLQSLAVNPKGEWLAVGGNEGSLRLWDGRRLEDVDASLKTPEQDPADLAALGKALDSATYEFGWEGGIANADDMLRTSYVQVTDAAFEKDKIHLSYDWEGGIIEGRLTGQEIHGRWIQRNGRGDVFLRFDRDFARAMGWWNEGGYTPRSPAFFRIVRPAPSNLRGERQAVSIARFAISMVH